MKQFCVGLAVCGLSLTIFANVPDRPQNPQPGACYTKVNVPARYRTVSERVLLRAESIKESTIPAKYTMVDQQVLVTSEKTKERIIPATYKVVQEKVLVSPERRVSTPVPAKFKTVTRRKLVKPAGYGWKKGTGPQQKMDSKTGEILCYQKIPAVYKDIKENVLVAEASVAETLIPARYKVVSKRVVDRPQKVVFDRTPATYRTVKVKQLVTPEKKIQTVVPAKYGSVRKKEKISDTRTEWRSILCASNASKSTIRKVQKALAQKNFFKGPLSGFYGPLTARALLKFQSAQGLATGGLTRETLGALGLGHLR